MTVSGGWACATSAGAGAAATSPGPKPRAERYVVEGTVIPDGGAPGTNTLDALAETVAATSTTVISMAPFGHPCTQAGASPSARRPAHRSHLRTMPRRWSYAGTSYGHV